MAHAEQAEQFEQVTYSEEEINDGKSIAIISYLTFIGLIIAFIMNNDKKNAFAAFHIRQVIGLCVTGIALSIVGAIPILGWLVSLVGSILIIVMWIMGILNAVNKKAKPLPVLGKYYAEWFKNI